MANSKSEQIIASARSWIGTPWMHNQAIKGVGVDCLRFVQQVGLENGVDIGEIGNYERSPVGDALYQSMASILTEIPVEELSAGDIMLFRATFKGNPTHVGISTGSGMIHADNKVGRVVEVSALGFYRRLLFAVFRVV